MGRERWDIFETTHAPGNRFAGPADLLHDGFDWAGCGALGILQQHTNFSDHHPDADHLQRADAALARLGIGTCLNGAGTNVVG